MATYDVHLYGNWEREGGGAAAYIDYVKDDPFFKSDYPRIGFELIDAKVARQEKRTNNDGWYPYTQVEKEYGTLHVRLDVNADNGQMALKKAKTKIERWLYNETCLPPKITWL